MPNPTENMSAVQECAQARERILGEVRKVIVGQEQVVDELLIALFADGHCLLVGVPGLAKTLLISHAGPGAGPEVQPHPVHARPDALATSPAPRSSRRTARPAQRAFKFIRGPGLRQHRPGRRDQPHAAQDAGRAAAGDAGEAGHRRRARPSRSSRRSSCWPRRTRSSRRAPIRCPRRSSTASCSTSRSTTRPRRRRSRSSPARPARHDADACRRVLSGADILRLQQTVRRVPVADHVVPYAVRLARATRPDSTAPAVRAGLGRLGRRARAPRSTWSSAPRPARSCTGARRRRPRTSARSPRRCCATASSPTSTPRPRA